MEEDAPKPEIPPPMVETKGLTKRYGDLLALDNLSITVNKGDIYGFIGPNGAGKSTTFKILATILIPDSGTAIIDGTPIRKGDSIRSLIGYMPDVFGVYEDMTVYQYLDFFGAAYYIPRKERTKLIADILELTDLAFKREAMVQSLSRGMQQRLGVARVLIHSPKVLILDEPASGLDPRARIELRELLKVLTEMGKTVLISSHILTELSELCNRLAIIEGGKLVFEGSRLALNQKLESHNNVTIQLAPDDREKAIALLQSAAFTDSVEKKDERTIQLRLTPNQKELHEVVKLLLDEGCRVSAFQPEELSLESAFMNLTEGKLA